MPIPRGRKFSVIMIKINTKEARLIENDKIYSELPIKKLDY